MGKALADLRTDRSKAEQKRGALQERVAARQRALDALIRGTVSVAADEVPEDALARHGGDVASAERRSAEILAADAMLEAERAATEGEHTKHLDAVARMKAELAKVRETIADGESRRERLATSVLLRKVTGAETVDPDAQGLAEQIQVHIRQLETKRLQDYRAIQDLDMDRGSIAATGLAAPDPDAQAALEWLAERGIGADTLGHYPTYLAETQPEAEAARRCLESDPARFGGLYVYRRQDLERIRLLPHDGLRLRRPVQVSLPRDEPTEPPADALVLSQPFDAAYDRPAAAQYARDLDVSHTEVQERIDELERSLNDARATSADLDAYLRVFGAGRLTALRQEALRLEQDIARLDASAGECAERLEEIRGRRVELAEELEEIREARYRAAHHKQALTRFIEEHESGLAETLNRLREIERQIESLGGEIADNEAKREELKQAGKPRSGPRPRTPGVMPRPSTGSLPRSPSTTIEWPDR